MEGEVGLVTGRSQREKKRSYKDFLREDDDDDLVEDEEQLVVKECKYKKSYKKKRRHSGDHTHPHRWTNGSAGPELDGVSHHDHQTCESPDEWMTEGERIDEVRPEVDPVNAAAHLQLLGESLSHIGHRLQGTKEMMAVSGSLSVLLDSLLCALAPLACLTSLVPELRSCPSHSHTLAKTLDNIAYVMPGL
ncbi:unnamed protein product [Coregonus sp. 'balchen']|nr:unnamed protein product [Coregonus sp. 'balchen']